MDLETTILQAQGLNWTVYVAQLCEGNSVETLSKFRRAAYGLTDAGRLLYLTSKDELVNLHGLARSKL